MPLGDASGSNKTNPLTSRARDQAYLPPSKDLGRIAVTFARANCVSPICRTRNRCRRSYWWLLMLTTSKSFGRSSLALWVIFLGTSWIHCMKQSSSLSLALAGWHAQTDGLACQKFCHCPIGDRPVSASRGPAANQNGYDRFTTTTVADISASALGRPKLSSR